MTIADRVVALTEKSEQRYRERTPIREQRIQAADRGDLWQSDDPDRIAKRLERIPEVQERIEARSPELTELAVSKQPAAAAREVETLVARIAQERIIGRDDMVTPQFLKLALAASRCICRITVRNETGSLLGYGTGVLVGPGVLLTNNHVLEKSADARQSEVTFGFELGTTALSDERLFSLNPELLFITDESLDFTLVAMNKVDSASRSVDDLGYITLNTEIGKVINGEFVNVIQHPNGGPKMLALRENRIVDVLTNYLHYTADTAPGSSGSPVFNDQFEIVALHHSGVPARDPQNRILNRSGQPWTSDQGEAQVQWTANEGVRVSVLVDRAKSLATTAEQRTLLERVLDVSRSVPSIESAVVSAGGAVPPVQDAPPGPVVTGRIATWTIPLTVSVGLGALPAASVAAGAAAAFASPPPPPGSSALPQTPLPTIPPKATGVADSATPELMRAVEHAKDLFNTIPGIVRIRAGWQFVDD